MILYFDSFITDVPFNKTFIDGDKWIRQTVPSYAMPSKIDIAKYTLASYANYPWSHVLIRFKLADTSRIAEFEEYARSLFPEAIILQPNSANQTEYRKSLSIINEWDDDWIWYAPNNDHPIIAPDLSIIDTTLAKAKLFSETNDFVSIIYSHFSEFTNVTRPGNPFWRLFGQDTTIIDEDADTLSYIQKNGENAGIQIINKKLFTYWFDSEDMGDAVIYRSEDVRKFHLTPNQLIVMPKREVAAHFDGYSHTIRGINEIVASQVPPLFIPIGFFDKTIKIAYGYKEYREGWTNINPAAKRYSFEDKKYGTDLKIVLEDIPLFWKQRIKEIDINKNIPGNALIAFTKKNNDIIKSPWKLGNRKIDLGYVFFILRNIRFRLKNLKH